MKKLLWTLAALLFAYAGQLQAQVLASFSLSANSTTVNGTSVPGWTNVYGDPHSGTRSATANGITLSSISQSNWLTDASGICAEDAAAPTGGTFFPENVLRNHWFQAGPNASFNQAYPQIRLSGLNKDSFYIIRMSSSSNYTAGDPTQYTVAGNTVYPSQNMYPYNNLATGVTFQHIYPDSTGVINIYVNTTPGKNVAYLAGVQIITGSSTVGIPTVAITSPENNDILAEETNVTINASASEPGSSISKVEFYSDTVKIGESDAAPYSFTWVNPDAGHYTIKAKATDISGASSTASINISIEPLSSFWSLTGNIHANGDSNFVGTVDTNRLAFRTNNLERMSILGDGTIGIGTKNTYGYKLAVNGNAIFGKVRIKTVGTWPDYVFKKGYVLPDLKQLEQYILEHKHLPGIIPEGEANREGFDIGEHQAALLKKIEELTLYLIRENRALKEQNQKITEQNAKLEDQQRQIDELKKLIKEK